MNERILILRRREKISQNELAFMCGYSSGAIVSMWENGTRTPPTLVLPALAKALNCTIDYLVTGENPKV